MFSRQSVAIENVRVSNFDWDDQTQTVWATLSNQTCAHSPVHRWPSPVARRPHTTTTHDTFHRSCHSPSMLPAGRVTVINDGFRTSSVEVPVIMPWKTANVRLTLHSKQGNIRSANDISNTTRFEYVAGASQASQNIGGDSTMRFYADKFRKKPDPALGVKRFNVMLFGLFGAGKSSFLNTVMTLFSDESHVISNAAIVGGGEEHTTTKLRATKVPDDAGGMAIWDTWGVSHGAGGGQAETYKSNELEMLLRGLLANNWDMSSCERIIDFQPELRKAVASAPQRRQHAVVFMFPYTLFGDEGLVDPRIHDAKRYLRKFFDMHIQPLILITQADIACPQLRANPMGTYPQTERMRQIAAKQIGVPLGHVYLMVNYVQETERSFNIDRNTYRILEAIQNRAVQHVRCRLPAPLPTHLHQPLSQRPSPGWPPCGYGTAPARWLAGWP